jgi:CubicO group peptidase (beta-lactamase class C family)
VTVIVQTTQPTTAEGIRDIKIDEAAVRAHVIRPAHVEDVVSSTGLLEGAPPVDLKFAPRDTYAFDGDAFCEQLHAALKDCVVGYVMRMRMTGGGYTLQWNWSKTPADGGQGWNPDVRMHVASCSKLVTGMAMTKLLNDKGLSYDTPISSCLPAYWSKGQNVGNITFRHLMTHRSGLNFGVKSSASDFNFMRAQIAAGTTKLGQYWYQNMNFGLCRILISTLNGNISTGAVFSHPNVANWNELMWDGVTIQAYAKYLKDRVFAPAGVVGPTLDHPAADALAYNFPDTGKGWNSGDLHAVSGGAGWHMSADDLLDVMGAFRRSGAIMSKTQAQTMLDSGFGIDVQQATPLGKLYNKNGRWANKAGQTEQGLAYFLPNNTELVVLANSPIGTPGKFFRDLVTNIYLSNIN